MKISAALIAWSVGAGAFVFCTLAVAPEANAAIISGTPNASFETSDYTLSFGGGAATYTFSNTNDFFNPVAVTTGGTATIASLGAPFYNPPQPTSYFTDDRAPFIDGSLLAQFLGYTSPATIPFSISDSFLALRFMLDDGLHYGYARVGGPTVFAFGYESEANAGIQAGAMAATVPEPANLALLSLGLFAMGGLAVRRKRDFHGTERIPA